MVDMQPDVGAFRTTYLAGSIISLYNSHPELCWDLWFFHLEVPDYFSNIFEPVR